MIYIAEVDTKFKKSVERAQDTSGYEEVHQNIRGNLGLAELNTVPYMWEDDPKPMMVTHDTNEVTSVCPKTGLPDFATVKVTYTPWKRLVELKSFKLYLTSYRQIGIFHEHLTKRILEDFCKVVNPRMCQVDVTMNNRGGINTTCMANWTNPEVENGFGFPTTHHHPIQINQADINIR